MNSSFKQLVQCINVFNSTIDFNAEFIESKRINEVNEIRKKIEMVDENALNENAWWSYILEQAEDGIL